MRTFLFLFTVFFFFFLAYLCSPGYITYTKRIRIDAIEPLFRASSAITQEKNKAERLTRIKDIEQGNNKSNFMQIFITAALLFPQDSNHTPNNTFL